MEHTFRIEHFEAEQIIFSRGDENTCAYFVESGTVAISRDIPQGSMLLDCLEPGAIFGEMGIICNQPRTATATAKIRCTLLAIDRPILEGMMRRTPVAIQSLVAA